MEREQVVGRWRCTELIGKGAFATVWKAQHMESGQLAAVKIIPTKALDKKVLHSLQSEIAILQHTSHKHIVQLLEVLKSPERTADGYPQTIFMVMEYCAGGDLASFMSSHGTLAEDTVRDLVLQLASGLKELRSNNIIHRDIKPQNLLLTSTGPDARLLIGDFGFARSLQPQGLAETLCGSPLYMAPEILALQKYDAKADLWSVGAILYEMLVGRPPFGGHNYMQLLRNIQNHDVTISPGLALSTPCKQLIKALLQRNPVERISFEGFFQHPFLAAATSAAGVSASPSMMPSTPPSPTPPLLASSHDASYHNAGAATSLQATTMTGTAPAAAETAVPETEPDAGSDAGFSDSMTNDFGSDYVLVHMASSPHASPSSSTVGPSEPGPPAAAEQPDAVQIPAASSAPDSGATVPYPEAWMPPPRPVLLVQVIQQLLALSEARQAKSMLLEALSMKTLCLQILDHLVSSQVAAPAVVEGLLKQHVGDWRQLMAQVGDACRQIALSMMHVSSEYPLPDMYELVLQAALIDTARPAAWDEMSAQPHLLREAEEKYERVNRLLWFLLAEAPRLQLQPPLVLDESQNLRLAGYISVISNRIASCHAAVAAAAAADAA